jgi:hypothetical protein
MDLNAILALVSGGAAALLAKFPILASVFMIMGALRAVLKPLMALFRAFVAYTPSKADDVLPDQVEASPLYKGVAFVLDYLASIKIGPAAK